MRRMQKYLGFTLLILAIAGNTELFAQAKGDKKMPSEEEMMNRWQAFMTPGAPHKMLEECVGTWDAEVKIWAKGPDGDATVSKGVSEQKMILGGRYLQQDFKGEMMGQAFTGIGLTGYDNLKKKYIGTWVDDMGTGIATMEGTPAKDGKSVTMLGKMDDPMTGQRDKKVRYVTRFVDKDTQVFETYDLTLFGDKKPTMQITYKRRK